MSSLPVNDFAMNLQGMAEARNSYTILMGNAAMPQLEGCYIENVQSSPSEIRVQFDRDLLILPANDQRHPPRNSIGRLSHVGRVSCQLYVLIVAFSLPLCPWLCSDHWSLRAHILPCEGSNIDLERELHSSVPAKAYYVTRKWGQGSSSSGGPTIDKMGHEHPISPTHWIFTGSSVSIHSISLLVINACPTHTDALPYKHAYTYVSALAETNIYISYLT
jgi:hypothetical protein